MYMLMQAHFLHVMQAECAEQEGKTWSQHVPVCSNNITAHKSTIGNVAGTPINQLCTRTCTCQLPGIMCTVHTCVGATTLYMYICKQCM